MKDKNSKYHLFKTGYEHTPTCIKGRGKREMGKRKGGRGKGERRRGKEGKKKEKEKGKKKKRRGKGKGKGKAESPARSNRTIFRVISITTSEESLAALNKCWLGDFELSIKS